MLKLYLKAQKAKTPEEIIEAASSTSYYLLHHKPKCDFKIFTTDIITLTFSIESMSIISYVTQSHTFSQSINSIFFYFFGVPTVIFFSGCKGSQLYRFATSSFINSLPWGICAEKWLKKHTNLTSTKQMNAAIIGVSSLYQMIALGNSAESNQGSIIETCGTYISIFCINYISAMLAKLIKDHTPIPSVVANFALSVFFASPLIRILSSDGIKNFVYTVFLLFTNKRYIEHEPFSFPPSFTIPNSLKCIFCYDLLEKPVVCKGHLFCKECLETWMKKPQRCLHPMTGEQICQGDVYPEYITDVLVNKYREHYRLYFQNSNNKQKKNV